MGFIIGSIMILLMFALAGCSVVGAPIPPCKPDLSRIDTLTQQAKWAQEHSRVQVRVVSIVSPDTIKVTFMVDKDGNTYTVHYRDVFALDPSHRYYQASLEENRRLVDSETVDLRECTEDDGNHWIWADVYVKDIHVNSRLVSQGYAFSRSGDGIERASSLDDEMLEAKAKGRGLWADWCADPSRFGGEDVVKRALIAGGQGQFLLDPLFQRVAAHMTETFKYSWIFHVLLQEHEGRDPGSPEEYFNKTFQTLYRENGSGQRSLLTGIALEKLQQILSAGQSCEAIFLNSPNNADFAERIRSGLGTFPLNAEQERRRSDLDSLKGLRR